MLSLVQFPTMRRGIPTQTVGTATVRPRRKIVQEMQHGLGHTMTDENVRRLIDKLERIAVNFWLMEMSADARSIEALLDEVSPESRDRIGAELGQIKAQRAAL